MEKIVISVILIPHYSRVAIQACVCPGATLVQSIVVDRGGAKGAMTPPNFWKI